MSEPMKLRARADAPMEDVRRVLTDPDALRTWLAEHAEVDLPHRYEFWGRYTPEGDAPHQRLLHVDERTLRFSWLLDGEDTTVEITLEHEGLTSTILSLSQTHFDQQEALDGTTIRGVLETFWALSIANLVDHLAGRELTGRYDFTSSDMSRQFVIDAPRDAVYHSIVDSETVTRWFGYPIEIEPRVGGRFAMGGLDADPAPAKVIELTPGRTMAVDWERFGITTWELEDSGGKTRLTFTQSGFDEPPPRAAWMGWLSGFAELRRFHELSDWAPIWISDQPTTRC